jgi:hypothetical protein
MKPAIFIFLVYLFALILLLMPILDLMTHRDLQPASKMHVDFLCSYAGLIGVFLGSALMSVHRRIARLEESAAPKNQKP